MSQKQFPGHFSPSNQMQLLNNEGENYVLHEEN